MTNDWSHLRKKKAKDSLHYPTSIATAVEEQSVTTNEVSGNVESMAMVSRDTEAASKSMQQAAQDLAQLGSELNEAISWFKVSAG